MSTPPQAPQQPPPPTLSPQQFLDQFLLVVAPITMRSGPTVLGTATGFFFSNNGRLFLVTNRHVVRQENDNYFPDSLRLRLHTNAQDATQNADYEISLYRNRLSTWREKPNVDLTAIEIPQQDMARFMIKALSVQQLPPPNLVVPLGNEVIVIGYPRGFSDVLHNYPIARTGAVASPYPVDFQGKSFFLVDAHLHPGTSGSPVLMKPTSMLTTSEGTVFSGMTTFFLGVNSGEVNFGVEQSGLNAIWYGRSVQEITGPAFQSPVFPQP